MNSFRNGTWHFRAGIEPSERKWRVHYWSKELGREGVVPLIDEIAAKQFAFANNGTVREIKPRPFRLERAR